jgi:histidinol-phosphate aminotransferase
MIEIPRFIQNLQPYVAGKPIEELAREKHLSRIVKLASNENPFGPSPKAIEAMQRSMADLHRYVDPGAYSLVHKIADHFGVKASQVITGSGVDALLSYTVKAFTKDGDEVLTSAGTFIGIYVNVNKHNRKLNLTPLDNYAYDLDALLARINPKTRLIYLANPNNPTGTSFSADEFEQFMAKVPKDILVILDEAYYSYAKANPEYPNGLTYKYDNLLVMRTFSKDYGLAGVRIGFAVGPEYLIRELYKVKLPFEPNYMAQQAAVAALDDAAFLEMTLITNARNMKRMVKAFAETGIQQVPSDANFILLLMPSEQFAVDFNLGCLDRGLIVRHVRSFGIPNGIRINTGTDDETNFAVHVVDDVYHAVMKTAPDFASQLEG